MVVKGEEVAAMALEADGFANRFPPGSLVTGAGVGSGSVKVSANSGA